MTAGLTHGAREALILVGGAGTRLASVSGGQPKPMLSVAGRPFLEWLLLTLERQGVQRAILSSGHRADVIMDWFGDTFRSLALVHSRETTPLGTGGALRAALPLIRGKELFVLNGDSYCRFSCERMEELRRRTGAPLVMWLSRVPDVGRFGSVSVDAQSRVTEFAEKKAPGAGLINAGVYLIQRDVIESIPDGAHISLERSVFPDNLNSGIYGVVGDELFVDIGTPESLLSASATLQAEFSILDKAKAVLPS